MHSNVGRWLSDDTGPDGGHMEWLTWKELADQRETEIGRLRWWQQMVADLDRNENGRHEGDADYGDPTGISQGNPQLRTGDILGYDIGGHPYVMPERGKRHNPDAWGARP